MYLAPEPGRITEVGGRYFNPLFGDAEAIDGPDVRAVLLQRNDMEGAGELFRRARGHQQFAMFLPSSRSNIGDRCWPQERGGAISPHRLVLCHLHGLRPVIVRVAPNKRQHRTCEDDQCSYSNHILDARFSPEPRIKAHRASMDDLH